MTRTLLLCVALVAASVSTTKTINTDARSGRQSAAATIGAVAWLSGAWTTAGAAATEERWLEPAGGAMLGTSRTIARDRMVAFEFLRIVERDGTLVYIAQPGGQPPTEFVLTSVSDGRAVFENPEHDYPKAIAYTRTGDALVARISDAGGLRPQEFQFTRKGGTER
jgi:hypothetical protein